MVRREDRVTNLLSLFIILVWLEIKFCSIWLKIEDHLWNIRTDKRYWSCLIISIFCPPSMPMNCAPKACNMIWSIRSMQITWTSSQNLHKRKQSWWPASSLVQSTSSSPKIWLNLLFKKCTIHNYITSN